MRARADNSMGDQSLRLTSGHHKIYIERETEVESTNEPNALELSFPKLENEFSSLQMIMPETLLWSNLAEKYRHVA